MNRYKIYGSQDSNQTIIALPALGERKEIYENLSVCLKEYKMIAIDLPGHNQFKKLDHSISMFVLEIEKILRKLNISSAHFIGNSIGGWIIQGFYSKFPHYVESLTLLDAGYYFLGEIVEEAEIIQLPVIERREDLEYAVSETINSMESLTEEEHAHFSTYLQNNFLLKEDLYIHHSDEEALNTLSNEVTIKDYTLKQKIEKPFLLLLAEYSMDEFSEEKVEVFKQFHTNLSVITIPNGYHFFPITNPKQVANALKKHKLVN